MFHLTDENDFPFVSFIIYFTQPASIRNSFNTPLNTSCWTLSRHKYSLQSLSAVQNSRPFICVCASSKSTFAQWDHNRNLNRFRFKVDNNKKKKRSTFRELCHLVSFILAFIFITVGLTISYPWHNSSCLNLWYLFAAHWVYRNWWRTFGFIFCFFILLIHGFFFRWLKWFIPRRWCR